ncbi:MAG: response regulator [Gemmatimonas sp.]|jgi:tRNA(Ile2) C34 agmatinyltransferase TiaS
MPDAQLTNKLSPSEVVHPRCPACEAGMNVLRVVSGRPGFEHRTLRCTKCGLTYEAQAPVDPLYPEALGWLQGGLKPPE